jgi:hypothetical protein
MCEAATRDTKTWWAIDGGYCLPYSLAYQTLGLDTTADTDKCAFSIKCALSNSLDQDCQCKSAAACRKLVNDSCAIANLYLSYPGSGFLFLISPYTGMLYVRERDWTNKKPDRLLYRGRVKCIGYQLITNGARRWTISEPFKFYLYKLSENRLCDMQEGTQGNRNYSGPHYDVNCWNTSKTFNNRSYQVSLKCETRCISKYRVRDGITDCQQSEETPTTNNSCPQIQPHRLQCSSSELTCFLAAELGNWAASCSNERDEFDHESGTVIDTNFIVCAQRADPGCVYFRKYISSSSYDNTDKTTNFDNSILDDDSITPIPFRSYCNSFFNTISGIDESLQFCHEWICFMDEYQCLSGQCILQSWVCDGKFILLTVSVLISIFVFFFFAGEWDCSDGSDEQRIFIMDSLNEHNSQLMNLTEMKQQCDQQYRSNNTPFSDICNISSEYPCFRIDIDDPFNLTLNRPCINLTQIGDGKTDCLSGLDERNRLQCSAHGMLGFHFQFNNNVCGRYRKLCTIYPWTPGTDVAYDTVCFHQRKQFKNGTASDCNTASDVMCLNDVCLKKARCDDKIDCLHGEDEYRCIPKGISQLDYRVDKKPMQPIRLRLRNYPSATHLSLKDHSYHHKSMDPDLPLIIGARNNLSNIPTELKLVDNVTIVYETRNSTVKSVYEIVRNKLPNGAITFENHYLPFICNRGVAVKYYTGHTVCFCSPSFYGSQCEFYSNRITVVTHLDLANYRSSTFHQIAVIKVLTTFLFESQIIDYYEFYVNPQFENENNYIKQGIYFLYPRTEEFSQMKKNNRSGTQLYSVRFEAFNLHFNETIEPIGVWQYPIYFDFLPAFRLSKILRFHPSVPLLSSGPCLNNLCGMNGTCQEIINSNRSSYFCSCQSGYYGIHCEDYEEECNNYCSPKSICKPKHRGILTGNQQPLCLCPASTFGNSCYLKNDHCRKSPCLNGGSCIVTYDLTDTDNYICLCTDSFAGDHCQFPRGMVSITIIRSPNTTLQTADVAATTVSYSDYFVPSLRFDVRHQQVYDTLPSHIKLMYSNKLTAFAPTIAVLKVYGPNYRNEEPRYYVLYFHSFQEDINITVDLASESHCPLIQITETSGKLE